MDYDPSSDAPYHDVYSDLNAEFEFEGTFLTSRGSLDNNERISSDDESDSSGETDDISAFSGSLSRVPTSGSLKRPPEFYSIRIKPQIFIFQNIVRDVQVQIFQFLLKRVHHIARYCVVCKQFQDIVLDPNSWKALTISESRWFRPMRIIELNEPYDSEHFFRKEELSVQKVVYKTELESERRKMLAKLSFFHSKLHSHLFDKVESLRWNRSSRFREEYKIVFTRLKAKEDWNEIKTMYFVRSPLRTILNDPSLMHNVRKFYLPNPPGGFRYYDFVRDVFTKWNNLTHVSFGTVAGVNHILDSEPIDLAMLLNRYPLEHMKELDIIMDGLISSEYSTLPRLHSLRKLKGSSCMCAGMVDFIDEMCLTSRNVETIAFDHRFGSYPIAYQSDFLEKFPLMECVATGVKWNRLQHMFVPINYCIAFCNLLCPESASRLTNVSLLSPIIHHSKTESKTPTNVDRVFMSALPPTITTFSIRANRTTVCLYDVWTRLTKLKHLHIFVSQSNMPLASDENYFTRQINKSFSTIPEDEIEPLIQKYMTRLQLHSLRDITVLNRFVPRLKVTATKSWGMRMRLHSTCRFKPSLRTLKQVMVNMSIDDWRVFVFEHRFIESIGLCVTQYENSIVPEHVRILDVCSNLRSLNVITIGSRRQIALKSNDGSRQTPWTAINEYIDTFLYLIEACPKLKSINMTFPRNFNKMYGLRCITMESRSKGLKLVSDVVKPRDNGEEYDVIEYESRHRRRRMRSHHHSHHR